MEYYLAMKKEESINACYKYEPWRYCDKWKKTEIKGHILFIWFYFYEMSQISKSTETEVD
jgi:hypothetical protein